MTKTIEGALDTKGIRVGILVTRTNEVVTSRLLGGAEDCLDRHGAGPDQRTVIKVPGAWELTGAAKKLAATGQFDMIVALGALVRGETPHFEVLAAAVARGLTTVGLDSGIPVVFGVLTTDTLDQAIERAGGKAGNKGWEAALAGIEMVSLYRRLS